jgi:uncharacterized membrane protein
MSRPARLPAVLAYIPVIGWLYVLIFQRSNLLALYHVRQSVGLILFVLGVFVGWVVIAWLLAWIPYGAVLGVAMFTLVMTAFFYGIVALIMGVINALNRRLAPLPLFGRWANRLPIR